jgi:hypothetical protein
MLVLGWADWWAGILGFSCSFSRFMRKSHKTFNESMLLTHFSDRVNWEIQTISEQLAFYLTDESAALRTASFFSVLLPVGGIIGSSNRVLELLLADTISRHTIVWMASRSPHYI